MIDIIIVLIIYMLTGVVNTFINFGINSITHPVKIFGFVHNIPLPEWVRMPLFECPICMSSIHSIIPFWLISYLLTEGNFTTIDLVIAVVGQFYYMLYLAGIATLIIKDED